MSDLLRSVEGMPAGHDADPVPRKTSTAFAALIGGPVLGEKVGPARAGLVALIAIGAGMMEWTR
ncbi:MAG: hypothetical protein J0L76_17920 [Rhodobacterales bacterium]|nr:hypothetical protein [Rhodobacterales bacterium]